MIRLAVIGRNFVVDSMIEAMKHVPELELCGICSRSAEGAREFGERYGIDPAHRYGHSCACARRGYRRGIYCNA